MQPERPITPSTLSVKDLPWQILWDKDKCTLCGKCTAVCPVNAIDLGVFRKRIVSPPMENFLQAPTAELTNYYGIRQKTDPAYKCVGCAMCALTCPNDAIMPCRSDEADKFTFQVDRGCPGRSAAPQGRSAQYGRRYFGPAQIYPDLHVDGSGA